MRRWVVAVVVAVAAAVAAVAYAATGSEPGGADPPGAAHAPAPRLAEGAAGQLPSGGRLLVRAVDEDSPRVDGALYELSFRGDFERVGDVECKRVAANAANVGLCLGVGENRISYDGMVLDGDYQAGVRFPIQGVPDRARLSANGRYAGYTSFDPAGSKSYFASTEGFRTYTRIVDLEDGKTVLKLENLEVTRDGRPFDSDGALYWGVTFFGDDRYYATLAIDGRHHLVEGTVGSAQAEVVADDVECPAVLPYEPSRIAYKRRIGKTNRWRLHVLDLATGRTVALAETRSIDDQPEWLGEDMIVYSDDEAVFTVPADGGGKPRLLINHATSPTYVGG